MSDRPFPLTFNGNYSYPKNYMNNVPCTHPCTRCDRTEAFWRVDPANPGATALALLTSTALVGVEWPPDSGAIPFPTALSTITQKLAFVKAALQNVQVSTQSALDAAVATDAAATTTIDATPVVDQP